MSDFPQASNYQHPLSDNANVYLHANGISSPSPLIINREKGAYVIDIDANKYCDFSLHNGRVVYGHQPGVLSKIIKNGLSTSQSYANSNKFLPRLLKNLHEMVDFDKAFLYNSERSMLLSLLQPVYSSRVAVSSSWLLQEILACSPLIDVELAQSGKEYDALFLEALDFDGDLSPIDPDDYLAKTKIGIVTRNFFRTENIFGLGLDKVNAVAVGSSISNGISSGMVLSRNLFDISSETASLYITLAIHETLKFYQRKGLNTHTYPTIKHNRIDIQKGGILKINTDPLQMLKYGLLTNNSVQFLCPEHSAHDIRRLQKAL